MKILTALIILLSVNSFGALESPYNKVMNSIETKMKDESWSKLVNWKEINSLSSDEKFKLADRLREEKLISRDLFFTTKNKPSAISSKIKEGQLGLKDREIHRLSLALISDINVKN